MALEDKFNVAGHENPPLVGEGDADDTAWHVDLNLIVHEAQASTGGGRGTAAAARGQGEARAAFPDLDADPLASHDLDQLDVHALRKGRVALNLRAQATGFGWCDALWEEDTVGIAHAEGGDGNRAMA